MQLVDDVKDGISFLKDLREKAGGHKDELAKAATGLSKLADMVKGLSTGDTAALDNAATEWAEVNKTLMAIASAKQELERKSVDWDKVGDVLIKVAQVAVKIAVLI